MESRNGAQAPVKRWRELLASERDAASLYERLADAETGERQEIFRDLAAIELRHAAHWEAKLRSAGADVPEPGGHADAGMYDNEPDALPSMAADERAHARTLA